MPNDENDPKCGTKEKVGQSLVCTFWISYWKLWMSLSLNIFSVFFAERLAIVFVSEPRTLHLGSESFSVLKSELVFFFLPMGSRIGRWNLLTHRVLSHTKVLLAKRKRDGKCYAIKVLQKKVILNRREVMIFLVLMSELYACSVMFFDIWLMNSLYIFLFMPAKAHYGGT